MTRPYAEFGSTTTRRLGALEEEDDLRKAFALWEQLQPIDRKPFAFYEVLWSGWVRGVRLRVGALPEGARLCDLCEGNGYGEESHQCDCGKCRAETDFKSCSRCYGEGIAR